ncbi:flavodoxin domain-containing protein [Propionibacteriaceae bacterium G1746]
MANVLVAYATRAGSTKDIAEAIAEGIREYGHHVEVEQFQRPGIGPAYEVPTDEVDAFVIGSGIQNGAWQGEALSWLGQHAGEFDGRPVALFNVCMTAADPGKRDVALGYNKTAAAKVGEVSAQQTFAGRFVPAKVGWFTRLVLRGASKGEARDEVDPDAARAWGRSLAGQLVAS